tara:strand:- start:59062 stop:59703 length:642 start_codon:yes stop_codon:yes gene_type:complete
MNSEQLSIALQLKAIPLEGKVVVLEPVLPSMKDEMRTAMDVDPEAWSIQNRSGYGENFEAYWAAMNAPREESQRVAYGVRLRASNLLVGTSSFHHISPENRSTEIGSTFLHPEVRGTAVNPEMKLLMLDHAFDSGALRIQLTVDDRNKRSQAAVKKLGAVREGLLRRHCVTWNGHNRDTVVFSVIGGDWPGIRTRLISRLEAQDGLRNHFQSE